MGRTLDKKTGLTAKQTAFVDTYLACNDPVKAYQTAYRSKTTNIATIRTEASRLLRNPKIQTYLESHTQQCRQTLGIDSGWVLQELIELYWQCKEQNKNGQAIQILEKIGKHHLIGAFDPKNSQDGEHYNIDIIDRLEKARARVYERHLKQKKDQRNKDRREKAAQLKKEKDDPVRCPGCNMLIPIAVWK